MAVGSGLSAQLMYKREATWGTAVTPDKGLEFRSEGIKNDGGTRFVSKGLKAGRLTQFRAGRGVVHIAGPIVMELPNANIAPWLVCMFGTVSGSSSPFTYTPGDFITKSMTVQVGRPSTDGTVQPFTWAGVKISEWEINAGLNDYVLLTSTISAKSETTATALAAASYASATAPFTFTGAVLSGAGAPAAVKTFTLKANNGLKLDREGAGSASIREQITASQRVFSGTIAAEFASLSSYADFVAQTQRALVATFTSGSDTLVLTMNCEFTGESPVVAGPDILEQPLSFECISSTSDAAAITAVLTNTDASAA
jgi:hypothetical protein